MKAKFLKFRIVLLVFVFAFLKVFNSCDHSYLEIEDIEDYTYSPVISFPLLNTSIGINNILELYDFESMQFDEDNLIKLVYKGQVYSLHASELFMIGNQASDFLFSFMPAKNGGEEKSNINETFPFVYDSEERIDVIKFNNGFLEIDINSDELINDGYELRFVVTIPDSDDGAGQAFSEEFLLQETPVEFDLSGYTVSFNTSEAGVNYFDINYVINVETHGQPDNAPYDLNFNQTIRDIGYEEFTGYVDNFDFNVGSEDIDLGFYAESILSVVFFKNPYIELFANNYMGIPLDIHFDRFYFNNNVSDTVDLDGYGFNEINPWRINSPAVMGDSVLTYVKTDRSNLNLDELLEISPVNATYHVRGEVNPSDDKNAQNFLRHNSQFNVDVQVTLPLWGNVERYVFQDTLNFSIKDINENMEWLELKFFVENGFPIDLSLQVYFIGENDSILDSLFTNEPKKVFEAAQVAADGSVTGITPKETSIMIDQNKLDNVNDSEAIILSFSMRTQQEASAKDNGDPFSVKLFNDHQVEVQMGVRAKINQALEIDLQ